MLKIFGAGALTLVSLSACGVGPSTAGSDAAPETAPIVAPAAPETTPPAPEPTPQQDAAVACGLGTNDNEPSTWRAELIGLTSTVLADGSVALVVLDPSSGTTSAVACMSADTAVASLKDRVSMGYVARVTDAVVVGILVPHGTKPTLGSLTAQSIDRSAVTGFDAYLYLVSDVDELTPNGNAAGSIAALIRSARQTGQVSVAGLGPDLIAAG